MSTIKDPNPDFGKSTISQKLYAAGVMLYILPSSLLSVVAARISKRRDISFKEHFTRVVVSSVLWGFPRQILRAPLEAEVEKALSSPRFSAVRENLYIPVQTSSFSGYWICQGSVSTKKDPKYSDITILFAHGGGYVLERVARYLPFLLRVAEVIVSNGLSVNILALDYSLAPESPFPVQLEQARAAYSYLLQDVGIPADKIALMGDSAGGSIMMSLLQSLTTPLPPIPTLLPKPSAVYLLSPWLSFKHTSPTFTLNAGIDLLTKSFLDNCVKYLCATSSHPASTIEVYTEFASEVSGRKPLSEILPRTVYASAGADEVFLADIESFAKLATDAGADVTLEVTAGKAHDWVYGEAVSTAPEYLKKTGDLGEDVLPATVQLALTIVKAAKRPGAEL